MFEDSTDIGKAFILAMVVMMAIGYFLERHYAKEWQEDRIKKEVMEHCK